MATVLATGSASASITIWILFFAIVAIVVVVLIVLKLIRNGNLSNAQRETSCPKCGKKMNNYNVIC